jgi:hypothetical protein
LKKDDQLTLFLCQVEVCEADIMRTEVTELQILRDHADYLTIFRNIQNF